MNRFFLSVLSSGSRVLGPCRIDVTALFDLPIGSLHRRTYEVSSSVDVDLFTPCSTTCTRPHDRLSTFGAGEHSCSCCSRRPRSRTPTCSRANDINLRATQVTFEQSSKSYCHVTFPFTRPYEPMLVRDLTLVQNETMKPIRR